MGGFSVPAAGQGAKPKVYELKNGAFRPAAPVKLKSPARKGPVIETGGKSPAQRATSQGFGKSLGCESKARKLRQMAGEIERLSGQSFQRSLLNLEDHAAHLDVALQLRLAAAERAQHRDVARRDAYRKRADALRIAALQTAHIRNQGAAGWASESAYGKLLASSAAADWAKARGDHLAQQSWAQQSKKFAQDLLKFRGWDYQLGLSGDRELLDAQAKATTPAQAKAAESKRNAAEVARLRQMIDSHVTRLERMKPQPAGNTRPDELHAARTRLLATTATMELMAGRKNEAKRALLEADRQAALEFRDLLKFQKTKTAGLPQLIRNWRGRKQLHQSLIDAGFEIPNRNWTGRERDLKAMAEIADRTLDRRGRNGADVAVVQALAQLEHVRPFVKKPPAAGAKPATPAGTIQPRVFDVREEARKARGTFIRDVPRRRTPPALPATGETSIP